VTTVLVADNDPGVRSLLAELARRQGYAVRTADDGEAACRELARGGIDVFVCDLDMPRLSGSQVLDWLAAQALQPATVVVSGYLDARTTAALGRRPWVRASLRKPFDVVAFVALLRGLAPGAPAAET
jgi:DNA-binding response OmpR family regulator